MDSVNQNRETETEEEDTKKSLPSDDLSKYINTISTLPKTNCFETTLYNYQGFWYQHDYVLGKMLAEQNFKPQPSDIILCSFPKTGTTWLKALAFAIVTRSHSTAEFPHQCVPVIKVGDHPDPRTPLLASHSSYSSLPPSIADSGCKIVYICRDPKDVFVSLWYFLKKFPYVNPEKYPSLEQGFELFCQGLVPAGPFWDHVLEYWKASLEFPERVLFLVYEDMKKDSVSVVKKLAEFMGYPFSMEEEEQDLVQKIVDSCSFEALSNLDVTKNGEQWPNSQFTVSNSSFFRKGEVGDWRNHLTEEMANRLDQITDEKLGASGFTYFSQQ
ncbi:flavonol 3-sulfotransferase-like [Mercurialis annua]|uniref:flavonol 3-sulfotransferase-like n=1 Tax=Mercurialis annua TaxID=3986 RepID=UPI00215FB98E|nr:flavonol 3-sulfotransferase-like [Mercurialis annua]